MKMAFVVILAAAILGVYSGVAVAGPYNNTDAVLAIHLTGKVKNMGCASTQANPLNNCLAVLPANYIVSDVAGPGGSLQGALGGIPCTGTGMSCNNSWAWLMVANMDEAGGIGGISCGIDWTILNTSNSYAEMIVAWTRCSDLEFPSGGWPGPGGGNRITWAVQTNCQRNQPAGGKVTACAGWFYVTSYNNYLIENAILQITDNYNTPAPELVVADCAAVETPVSSGNAGWAGWNYGGCPSPGCMVPGCNPYTGSCLFGAVESTTWGRLKHQLGHRLTYHK